MHDAVHYRLFHDRRLAEIASNWFCAFPVGMVTSLYRRSHLAHHFFTNKPADPDWAILVKDEDFAFPKARGAFFKLLLGDLVGANLGSWWKTIRAWLGYPYLFRRAGGGFLSRSERIQFGVFWLAVLATVTWLRAWPWFVILWVLPNYTLTLAFMRIRAIAEHDLHRSQTELDRTRHVDGTFIERNTVAPLNINYHIVHHLWPSIPLYNLPRMHAIVMQNARFRAKALAWRSYFGRAGGLFSTLLV
jgi:fatty acid desaturase